MEQAKVTLLRRRRTKIVATLGPASTDPRTVRELIGAGVDVFRMNMSHGDHETHRKAHAEVRAAATEAGQPVAILADLCGPKIRVGRFPDGPILLEDGTGVTVTTRDVPGRPGLIPSQYKALADDVQPGCRLLLADGLLELTVDRVEGTEVACTVVHGGVLSDRKGINLPDVTVSAPALTPKDRQDAAFALELGVEYFALSFVRHAGDVEDLRALLPPGDATRIIAKIERPEALDAADAILDAADGIMVARGDLGVELPPEAVPVAQRRLVAQARAKSKPCIVATQMLESMIEHSQPTRAEVSDVSTAVFSGADAVMLSAETAAGSYPVHAVAMMDRIARRIEGYQWSEGTFRTDSPEPEGAIPLHTALARATAQLSRDLRVRAIVVFSASGATAEVVAGARPAAPVLAATTDQRTFRQMNLLWGVVPVLVDDAELDDPRGLARRLTRTLDLASPGEFVLAVAGVAGAATDQAPSITALRA